MPWALFSRSAHVRLLRPLSRTSVRCQKPRSDVAPRPLSGHFCAVPPILNPQTLSRHFCAAPAHRFASCHLAGAQSCAPDYAAGPQTLPNSPPNDGKPSPASAKPPEAVSKFHQPRQNSEVYEPLRKSPTFSTKPRVSLHLVCCRPQVSPYSDCHFYLSPEHPPPDLQQSPSVPPLALPPLSRPSPDLQQSLSIRLAAGPEYPPPNLQQAPSVPPLGSQRSQLSRAGFNRSPVTFHMQVSSDAQFRASAANP